MFQLQVLYEYQKPWPKDGPLHIEAQIAGEVAVSPAAARRRAAGFLAGHVAMMVLAGEPVLIWGKRPIWRVPARLHLPGLGEVATIGSVDVDGLTGQVIPPPTEQITAMQRRADEIATRLSPTSAPAS